MKGEVYCDSLGGGNSVAVPGVVMTFFSGDLLQKSFGCFKDKEKSCG